MAERLSATPGSSATAGASGKVGIGGWSRRALSALGLVGFATLAILLGGIVVLALVGAGNSDQLMFLPAIASPVCGLLAWACWWLLVDELR